MKILQRNRFHWLGNNLKRAATNKRHQIYTGHNLSLSEAKKTTAGRRLRRWNETCLHTDCTHMCAFGENHHHVWKTKYPRQESHGEKHGEKFSGQQWATKGES